MPLRIISTANSNPHRPIIHSSSTAALTTHPLSAESLLQAILDDHDERLADMLLPLVLVVVARPLPRRHSVRLMAAWKSAAAAAVGSEGIGSAAADVAMERLAEERHRRRGRFRRLTVASAALLVGHLVIWNDGRVVVVAEQEEEERSKMTRRRPDSRNECHPTGRRAVKDPTSAAPDSAHRQHQLGQPRLPIGERGTRGSKKGAVRMLAAEEEEEAAFVRWDDGMAASLPRVRLGVESLGASTAAVVTGTEEAGMAAATATIAATTTTTMARSPRGWSTRLLRCLLAAAAAMQEE